MTQAPAQCSEVASPKCDACYCNTVVDPRVSSYVSPRYPELPTHILARLLAVAPHLDLELPRLALVHRHVLVPDELVRRQVGKLVGT